MGLPRQPARPQTQLSRLEAQSGRRAPPALSRRPKQTPRQPMQRALLRRTALRSSMRQSKEAKQGANKAWGTGAKAGTASLSQPHGAAQKHGQPGAEGGAESTPPPDTCTGSITFLRQKALTLLGNEVAVWR